MDEQETKKAASWIWTCTKVVIIILTAIYVTNWLYSAVVITIAIIQTGQFSYLDSLIVETNETFRKIVEGYLIKTAFENVFKFNDFGGKVRSKGGEDTNVLTSDDVPDINVGNNEVTDNEA